jgi:hypothetical protein
MKLLNFELGTDGISLKGMDLHWDLHNFADFLGFEYVASGNMLDLKWKVPKIDYAWGGADNTHSGCVLRFKNIKSVQISESDRRLPLSEGLCVHAIERYDSPKVPRSNTETEFLIFDFQNSRRIEVNADSVELIAV